jgi:putative Holliday junction resolvase
VTAHKLIGIDFGERRIGVAVADGGVAVPVTIVEHAGREADLNSVSAIVHEYAPAAVVVGLPLLPSGSESDQTRRCRRFGDALARIIDVPVEYQDELLSSADVSSARISLNARRPKSHIDDLAAARILQAYIDDHGQSL